MIHLYNVEMYQFGQAVYHPVFFNIKVFFLFPIYVLEISIGGLAMKFYRDITAIFTFIIALFLLIGCTPGKAQSRKDGDYQRYNEETGRYTADSKAGKNRHYARGIFALPGPVHESLPKWREHHRGATGPRRIGPTASIRARLG